MNAGTVERLSCILMNSAIKKIDSSPDHNFESISRSFKNLMRSSMRLQYEWIVFSLRTVADAAFHKCRRTASIGRPAFSAASMKPECSRRLRAISNSLVLADKQLTALLERSDFLMRSSTGISGMTLLRLSGGAFFEV